MLGTGHVVDVVGTVMSPGGRGRDRLAVGDGGDEGWSCLRSLVEGFFSSRLGVSFEWSRELSTSSATPWYPSCTTMVRRRGILGESLRGGTDRVGLGDTGICIDREGPKRGPCTRGPTGGEDTKSVGRSYVCDMGEIVGSGGRPRLGGG